MLVLPDFQGKPGNAKAGERVSSPAAALSFAWSPDFSAAAKAAAADGPLVKWESPGDGGGQPFATGKSRGEAYAGPARLLAEWTFETWISVSDFVLDSCGLEFCSDQMTFCARAGRFFSLGGEGAGGTLALRLDGGHEELVVTAEGQDRSKHRIFRTGSWHHLALEKRPGDEARLYYDGAEVSRARGYPARMALVTGARAVLGDPEGAFQKLALRGTALYERALGAERIAAHAAAGGLAGPVANAVTGPVTAPAAVAGGRKTADPPVSAPLLRR